MNLEEFDFKEQYQTFHNFGYAKAPDGSDKVVGNKWLHEKFGGRTIFDTRQADYAKELSRKREHSGKGSHFFSVSLTCSIGRPELEGSLGGLPGRRGGPNDLRRERRNDGVAARVAGAEQGQESARGGLARAIRRS